LQRRSGTGKVIGMVKEFQVGDVLQSRYEIQRLLRRALDKCVYLAHDTKFDCLVAVDAFINNSIMPSGLSVSAWEARVLGQLGDHPNIARVQDHWEDDGMAVMVTRYLPGGSLRDLIPSPRESGEGVPVETILRVSFEIAQALDHIHGRRILYRDLQPRNVLFDERRTVHLVDFDTAVRLDDCNMSDLSDRSVVEYMAPELTDGGIADERADLYSLGATMYYMATGHPPFMGTREEILAARRAGPVPSLDRADLPAAFCDLVRSLLTPEAGERPTSAAEVVERLDLLRTLRIDPDIERLLACQEDSTLEFKSSLRTPVDPLRPGEKKTLDEIAKSIQYKILQTLAAFHNTEGGTLVIGVTDYKTPIGIEFDFPSLKKKPNHDGWRLAFDDLVSDNLGRAVMSCLDLRLEPWQGKTVAVIRCVKRGEPTWLDGELYVRRTASTVKLSACDAVAWVREKWG
jgi:serine/threonine protein kinase